MAHGVSAFDLKSAEFRVDPHPILAAMRREMSVYSQVTDSPLVWGRGTIWYPLRYDDSVAVLRDSRRDRRLWTMAGEKASWTSLRSRMLGRLAGDQARVDPLREIRLRRHVRKLASIEA